MATTSTNGNSNGESPAAPPFQTFKHYDSENFEWELSQWLAHVRAHVDTVSVRKKYREYWRLVNDRVNQSNFRGRGRERERTVRIRDTLSKMLSESTRRVPNPPPNNAFKWFKWTSTDNFESRFSEWIAHVRANIDTDDEVRMRYIIYCSHISDALQIDSLEGHVREQAQRVLRELIAIIREAENRASPPVANSGNTQPQERNAPRNAPPQDGAPSAAHAPFQRFNYTNAEDFESRLALWTAHAQAHIGAAGIRKQYEDFYNEIDWCLQVADYRGEEHLRDVGVKVRDALGKMLVESQRRMSLRYQSNAMMNREGPEE